MPPMHGVSSADGMGLSRTIQDPRLSPANLPMRPVTVADGSWFNQISSANPRDGMQPRFIPPGQMGMSQFVPVATNDPMQQHRFISPHPVEGVPGQMPHTTPSVDMQPRLQTGQMRRPVGQDGVPPRLPLSVNQGPLMPQQIAGQMHPQSVRSQYSGPRGPVSSEMDGQVFNRTPMLPESNEQMHRPMMMNANQSRFRMEQPIRPPFQQPPNQMRPQPLIQPQPPMQFRPPAPPDAMRTLEESRMSFVSRASVSTVPPMCTNLDQARFPVNGSMQAPLDSRYQGQMMRPQYRPMQDQNLIPRQPGAQMLPQRALITSQYLPTLDRVVSAQGMQPQQQNAMPGQRQPVPRQQQFGSPVAGDPRAGMFVTRDSGQGLEQPISLLNRPAMNPTGPQQLYQRPYSNPDQPRYQQLPEPMQPSRRLPEPLVPDMMNYEMQQPQQHQQPQKQPQQQPQQQPQGPTDLQRTDPRRFMDTGVAPPQRQMSSNQMQTVGSELNQRPEGNMMNPNPSLLQQPQPGGQSSPQQSFQYGDSQGPPMREADGGLQVGPPRAMQLTNEQPMSPLMSGIMHSPTYRPPNMSDENLPMYAINRSSSKPSKYAFQGPVSSPLPVNAATMDPNCSSVPLSFADKIYQSPSAPPQPTGVQNPNLRNLPPFSPNQVYDPVTMNNRPVMAASHSGDSLGAGVLGNQASTQGQTTAQAPESMQTGLHQFQMQQLLLQQQQLISMIQSQHSQQRASESIQMEKLQMQLVDQQRYIEQLANEQHKIQHKQEIPVEPEKNQFLLAQFQQQIFNQNQLLKQQQQQLEQLRLQSVQRAAQKPAEKAPDKDLPDLENKNHEQNPVQGKANSEMNLLMNQSPVLLISNEVTIASEARAQHKGLNANQPSDDVVVAQNDAVVGSGIEKQPVEDGCRQKEKQEAKEQLIVDLDQFEHEMDAVLSGAVSNSLTTPPSMQTTQSQNSQPPIDATTKSDEKLSQVNPSVEYVQNIAECVSGSKLAALTSRVETNFPFYEPMLDKEQDLRLKQITSSCTDESSYVTCPSSTQQKEDDAASEARSKCSDLSPVDNTQTASSPVSSTDEITPIDNKSPGDSYTYSEAARAVELLTDDTMKTGASKLPIDGDISSGLAFDDTEKKDDQATAEKSEQPKEPASSDLASCGTDAGLTTSAVSSPVSNPIAIPSVTETLIPDDSSPTRPHLDRQEGRMSFYQAAGKDQEWKAYLADLDASVERMHLQCMELCKKISGTPRDGFTQLWNVRIQHYFLISSCFHGGRPEQCLCSA